VELHLGPDYAWPGNVRELEQCVRNVLVRRCYQPRAVATSVSDPLDEHLRDGPMTAAELVSRYCTYVYARTGSYQETARRLELDRRTVKRNVQADRLDELRGGADAPVDSH
tara:strand:- start:579 stop:911 length:333 start_codon:yes stop_codon:yes gene_type:complete